MSPLVIHITAVGRNPLINYRIYRRAVADSEANDDKSDGIGYLDAGPQRSTYIKMSALTGCHSNCRNIGRLLHNGVIPIAH